MQYEQLTFLDVIDNLTELSFEKTDQLTLGDIIHVKWRNGVEWEGIYTGLKGFWDNRPEFRHWEWIYGTKVWNQREARETSQYVHVDLDDDEWYVVGRDDSYRIPVKESYEFELSERLSHVQFPKRLAEYQRFTSEVPHLSYEHHPWVSKAWESAIGQVTTIDEFLSAEKEWTCKLTLPQKAANYIKTVVFSSEPENRLEMIMRMRWLLHEDEIRGETKYYIEMPAQREMTYYGSLYVQFIQQARTPNELVVVVGMRGGERRFIDDKPTSEFWIDPERSE